MDNLYIRLLTLAKGVSKFCIGMEGNISGKIDDKIVIKASGTRLSKLGSDDLVQFDFHGKQLDQFDKKGSMELSFHTYLLGFEDINYIAHTHPVNTLKVLCGPYLNYFSNRRLFPDQVVFNGSESCLVPYAKPGVELTEVIKIYVSEFLIKNGYFPKLILLENHGIITCGKTVEECIIGTEMCEKAAEIFIANEDKSKFLTKYDVSGLVNDEQEKYRQNQLK